MIRLINFIFYKIFELLEEFNLTVGQSFHLYQIIKEEEEFNDVPQLNENKIIDNKNSINNNNKSKNFKKDKRKLKN